MASPNIRGGRNTYSMMSGSMSVHIVTESPKMPDGWMGGYGGSIAGVGQSSRVVALKCSAIIYLLTCSILVSEGHKHARHEDHTGVW